MTTRRTRKSDGVEQPNERPKANASRVASKRRAPHMTGAVSSLRQDDIPWQPPVVLTSAEIATRAFLLYLRRGAQPGRDLDDWLQAERELIAEGRRMSTSAQTR